MRPMVLKVFIKNDCPNAPAAREVANQFPFSKLIDIDTPEGYAEASFHSVLCTPSFVLVDDNDAVINSWRCHVPRPTEIANFAG
jgi:hypothetical protein